MYIKFMQTSDYNLFADGVNLGGNLILWGAVAYGAAKIANEGMKRFGWSEKTRSNVNFVPKTVGKIAIGAGVVSFGAAGVILASVLYHMSNRR